MLQEMADKRRREEEEMQILAQQAQEKRKKFRDVSFNIAYSFPKYFTVIIFRRCWKKQ